jgi:RHS repeat-associated protein
MGEVARPEASPAPPTQLVTAAEDARVRGSPQLDLVTRPDGSTVTFSYGATTGLLGQVVTSTGTTSLAYYGNGTCSGCAPRRVSAMSGPGPVSLAFAYNGPLLRSVTASPTSGSPLHSALVQWTYNQDLRLATEQPTNGAVMAYGYDRDGLVTCVESTGGACNPADTAALSATYRADNGLLQSTKLGGVNGVVDALTYNSSGELASYTAQYAGGQIYAETVDAPGATRDALGRITTKTETIGGTTKAAQYGYDALGRLHTVTEDGTLVRQYDYDQNGNRTTVTSGGVPTTATYDAQDRLLSYGTATYAYGASGDLQSKTDPGGTTTYQYDALGNLLHVGLPGGKIVDYIVDGLGRRVGKKVNGALVAQWVYRDGLHPVAEYSGTGALVAQYVYGVRSNVPSFVLRGGKTYRIVADHLGSARLAVDVATGVVAERIDYDEWGKVLGDTTPGWMPFGFAGGVYDADTGLVRFGARDYDAVTGRWTVKDPVFFRGGQTNLYVYASNNSVDRRDPTGLFDIFFGGDFDLVPVVGGEVSFGVVFDTDHPLDSGLYGNLSGAMGLSFGAAFQVGVARDIEGWGHGIDANFGAVSPTLGLANGQLNSVAIGIGPGWGASMSTGPTGTLTIRDVVNFFRRVVDSCKR